MADPNPSSSSSSSATAAAASSSTTTMNHNDFVYAGGEFEDDAPYVEELHGLGVVGTTASFGQASFEDYSQFQFRDEEEEEEQKGEDRQQQQQEATGSGTDGLEALLSSLLDGAGGGGGGNGDGGFEDADTCFSINAAASFAALIAPEDQLAEAGLQVIEAEQAQGVVDMLTPLEVMSLLLCLDEFRVVTNPSTIATMPSAMKSIPLFLASSNEPSAKMRNAWFAASEKQIIQGLAMIGVGLNRESIPASAGAAAATDSSSAAIATPTPPLTIYSLLFRGSKLNSPSRLIPLKQDVHTLMGLSDVVQLPLLIKQILSESVRTAGEIMEIYEQIKPKQQQQSKDSSASASASASTSSCAAPSSTISTIVSDLLSQLSQVQSDVSFTSFSSSPSSLVAPFILDLDSGFMTCPDFGGAYNALLTGADLTPQFTSLRSMLALAPVSGSSMESASNMGELFNRLIVYCMYETNRAVWSAIVAKVRSVMPSSAAAAADSSSVTTSAASIASASLFDASTLLLLLCSQSLESPLASLLSQDSESASEPANFFARFIPAALEQQLQTFNDAPSPSNSDETNRYHIALRDLVPQLQSLFQPSASASSSSTPISALPTDLSLQRRIARALFDGSL